MGVPTMSNDVLCSCCRDRYDGPQLSVDAQRYLNNIRGVYRTPKQRVCGECGEPGHYRSTCPDIRKETQR
jgi:hypothetical protein